MMFFLFLFFTSFRDSLRVLYIPWAAVHLYTTVGPEEQVILLNASVSLLEPLFRARPRIKTPSPHL